MRSTSLRLAAPLAAFAVLLTACASDEPAETTTPSELPSDGQDADAAGGTRPADVEFTTEERVDMLLGATQEEAENLALEFGWTVRVGRIDGESFALTEDYAIGRMTIELDTGEDGVAVVTRVVVELDGGPQTFDA